MDLQAVLGDEFSWHLQWFGDLLSCLLDDLLGLAVDFLLDGLLVVTAWVGLQRFLFVPRAENLPSGKVSSNEVKGWSGTVLIVALVIPALEMNVVETTSIVMP